MDSQASILWTLLFSSVGLGFFIYGKKQRMAVPLIVGIALIIYPYFFSNVLLIVAVGALLTAIPYFFRF